MSLSLVLWGAGFLGNAALLFVLLYRRRFHLVPFFTTWIGVELLYNSVGFLVFRYGSKHLYAVTYWSSNVLDVLLQIAVVLEIAAVVLRRSGRWVEGARVRLSLLGGTAPLVALGMAWFMQPAAETRLDAWIARASLFTTILIFGLFIAVVMASYQLGLGWRSYAIRESYGLVVWVMVAFMTDTLHAYWRTLGHFTLLENIRIAVFQAASIYWVIAFWLPEPAPKPMTAEDSTRLNALREELECSDRSHGASPADGALPK